MKKVLLLVILFLFNSSSVSASTSSADSYILMDMDTNRVLLSKDKDEKKLIASITKIMTCVLAIESGKLDETVIVSDVINNTYGSSIYIEIGEEILLRDLLYGLMLRSGNDAAIMIASYVSGSEKEFVKKMNHKAKEIGMKNTLFTNSSGLDDKIGNYSTVYDMALLTSYTMEYEEYRKIVSTKKYVVKSSHKSYIWHNKNKLLSLDYITGGKTGFTKKAHRTLVTTANVDNMNLVVVTLNDSDDWSTHKSLYNYAKKNYKSYKILNKNTFRVVDDKYFNNNLYIDDDLYLTLNDKEVNLLSNKIILEKVKSYHNGMKVGENNIYLKNKLIIKKDIYVKKVKIEEKKGFWDKFWELIKFW